MENVSSIGDGGFDASCAKTPTRKKCAKTTTQKKTGLTGEKWKPPNGKSQGHIGKTGFNRKKAVLTGKSVTKNKKPKTLKEMSIY